MTREEILKEIAVLKRGVANADAACAGLIETYGHGCRPSTVSGDLAYYGERAARYTAEIKRLSALCSIPESRSS